ncbi:unnamed protein product [Adineta ricciae]|uniref:Uncharacterized protein n=1 Tax=Adineta ricciae TaxID=249248 RepID=A0A814K2X2_ADIRI|nr:unnamed protein product [Adineta ricciae]CAF1331178.1 unnamed protein product [Adineta ricciae]
MRILQLLWIVLWQLLTYASEDHSSSNQTSPWSCYLTSERRLECRNLFNFYLTSYSLCRNDYRLLVNQKIDELKIFHDYNCLDHQEHCYFEFDSTWSHCFELLRKITIINLSFIVRLYDSRKLLPIDYLKIVNTHGSVTELLHLFQFSNRTSIYIENVLPRWSGMDLYSIFFQYRSVRFKQLWINVVDWYPIVYMREDQQLAIRQWLLQIPCLHIELGDCRLYHYDLLFLRDLYGLRHDVPEELFCYANYGTQRFHWSQIPALYYGYRIPQRSLSNVLLATELHEKCFEQFTKERYTINSYTDLLDFYSYFRTYESYALPVWAVYPYATLATLPISFTTTTTPLTANASIDDGALDLPRFDYINIYEHAAMFNETRWLSAVEAYPDGRFLVIDNGNQQILLLNVNGSYRIDLTPIFFHQIEHLNQAIDSSPSVHNAYSIAHVHIDQDSYVYLVPKLAYYIYVFSHENRLVRCLTPQILGVPIIRSDCVAITHTGLVYVCDDAYRMVRIYSRMGVPHKTMRLDYLPLKLFISNNRLFTYSLEYPATIHMYTLTGAVIRKLTFCVYNSPSEVVWFRGKYFITCGTFLYVVDEDGNQIAEYNLRLLLSSSDKSVIIHDFALNEDGLLLVTFRRNGTFLNRYWIIRPLTS